MRQELRKLNKLIMRIYIKPYYLLFNYNSMLSTGYSKDESLKLISAYVLSFFKIN